MKKEDYDVAFILEVKMALDDVYVASQKKARPESRIIIKAMSKKYGQLLDELMEEEFGGET